MTLQTPSNTYEIASLKAPYTDLLQASGVASAADLARNNPAKLLRWMEEVNAEQRIVRKMPTLDVVSEWVQMAKTRSPQAA